MQTGCPHGLPQDNRSRRPVARSGLPGVVHAELEGHEGHAHGAEYHQRALPVQSHQGKSTATTMRHTESCSFPGPLEGEYRQTSSIHNAVVVWGCLVKKQHAHTSSNFSPGTMFGPVSRLRVFSRGWRRRGSGVGVGVGGLHIWKPQGRHASGINGRRAYSFGSLRRALAIIQ